MFTVVITEKGGAQKRMEFDKQEVTIGRVQGNDIILPKGNVSKRHSRIVIKDGKFIIVDLKSTNGTYVNGRKITSPLVIKGTDKIYIGDFILHVEEGGEAAMASPSASQVMAAKKGPPPPPGANKATVPDVSAEEMANMAGDDDDMASPPRAEPPPREPAPPPQRAPSPPREVENGRSALGGPSASMLRPSAPPPREAPAAREPIAARDGGAARPIGGPPARESVREAPLAPPPREAPAAREPAQARGGDAAGPAPLRRPPVAPVREPAAPPPRAEPRPAPAPPRGEAGKKPVDLSRVLHDRLVERMGLDRIPLDRLGDEDLWDKAGQALYEIADQLQAEGAIPTTVDQESLLKDVLSEALGLGPLEDLLADEEVAEVMVNGPAQIFARRADRVDQVDRRFSSEGSLLSVIERLTAPLGLRLAESGPYVEARLRDGARLVATLPPLAARGPALTVRKVRRERLTMDDLVRLGTLSAAIAEFLEMAVVQGRRNILITGQAGVGKSTLLSAVAGFVPDAERIVSVEDPAELDLGRDQWVQLEARPPAVDGKSLTARDAVRAALRIRPERLLVSDIRGQEALDVLEATAGTCDGALLSMSALSSSDALERLAILAQLSAESGGRALRGLVAQAIQVVVHLTRFGDGSRRVTRVSEVTGLDGDTVTVQDVFTYKQEGADDQGRVRGRFLATGKVPRFYEELQRKGVAVNNNIFRD
jgi:pilus assembly protein CpaF